MSKDIWHKADIAPDPYRSFVINTDKRNIYTGIITNPTEWNPMILPEFYSIGDIDKAERAIRYAYLDDLLALETELDLTRKALEIAKNAINSALDHNIINCVARDIDPRTDDTNVTLCNALEQITALEQKE